MLPVNQDLQHVLNLLSDHVAILNNDGTIIAVNESWEVFGKENGGEFSSVGLNYLTVLRESGRTDVYNMILRVLCDEKEEAHLAYPCHSPDEERWFQMVIKPFSFEDGTDGAIVIHRNITVEVVSKHSLRNVLESMTDAFFSLNEKGEFVYLNNEASLILNKSSKELLGKNIWIEYPDAVHEAFYTNYQKTMKERVTTRFEEYHESLKTWFEVVAYPRNNGGISVYFRNINERKEAEQNLHFYAYHDYLTGLPNRRSISKTIQAEIDQPQPFALLFIDLNGFKHINDMYGHEKGDELLKKVGKRLQEKIGPEHFIGRLGGDEFLILKKGVVSKEEIEQFSDRVLSSFARPIIIDDLTSFTISASIGISLYPENGDRLNDLMSMADTAMYEAKRQHGNQYVYFAKEMYTQLERRLTIEQDLAGDLKEKGLYFVLQPQMDIEEQVLIGVEVLSRWNHPKLGFIPPPEFIQIAEENGYILKLTSYMFCEIFLEMKKWIEQFDFKPRVSFNVTPFLLSSESFFTDFFDLLERFGIPASYIELEITEETELTTSSTAFKNLLRCREKGILISVDDFGTGYSTLSYLIHFPVGKVKIDKYFIDQVEQDEQAEAVLKSIIQLSENLGYEVVAEGVETKRQADFLKENGCFNIQGYFVDRPLPMDVFERKYVRGENVGTIDSN
ncbi:hypothetical protein BTO30_03525 [Domibacillus antri]|uniref:GGDEF domain-containing protein n=1 Tax=Domibacillus antri TaxID=1714264 RepID=A0A1Q8Q8M3_9BACI|nr:EAL domain-containing protein [Domibacillus antri]OLN23651.1 hypothetical protein BTO30_03525 [Domibacillus antri]